MDKLKQLESFVSVSTRGSLTAAARAEGVAISPNRFETLKEYMDNIPPTTRSSLLIDLQAGKRIDTEIDQALGATGAGKASEDLKALKAKLGYAE